MGKKKKEKKDKKQSELLRANATEENFKILKIYKGICKNRGLTEKSIIHMCDIDMRLFLEFIGDKPFVDVTHVDVEDFLTHCSTVRNNLPQSLARKYTSLCSFFKTAIRQELVPIYKNPLDKVDKPKYRQKVREHLTLEEYQQLLDYVDSIGDLRGGALISFFFSSACRLTEGWQQNRDNLDYIKRQFKVLGKGDKERICVFSQDAKERILKYLESRADNNPALFRSRMGNRWSPRAIQKYLKDAGVKAGLTKNVHPHLFRHTRAMALLRQDVPLDKIQKLLGHASIATTQIYAHNNIEDVQELIDRLDDIE